MRPLRGCVGYGESLGEHSAEPLEQLLLMAGRQILPPGFGQWRRVQARGGAGAGRLDMVRLLRRGRETPDRSGPGRAGPTGTRLPLLYQRRQRLRLEEVVVGSSLIVLIKRSAYPFSSGSPTLAMLISTSRPVSIST